jgi:hypothetical protein
MSNVIDNGFVTLAICSPGGSQPTHPARINFRPRGSKCRNPARYVRFGVKLIRAGPSWGVPLPPPVWLSAELPRVSATSGEPVTMIVPHPLATAAAAGVRPFPDQGPPLFAQENP